MRIAITDRRVSNLNTLFTKQDHNKRGKNNHDTTLTKNMNRFRKFTILAAAIFAAGGYLTSCSDDNPWAEEGKEGKISLQLTAASDVERAVPKVTRAESQAPDVPNGDEFSITLSRIDGSWNQTYATLAEFNAVGSFKTGAYNLKASYGSLDDEGFEKPCYQGETQLTVLEDRTTDVSVTATLASAMVSINYTPAFKQYFAAWSAKVHTEGHSYVTFSSTETRPAYIAPGTTQISFEITDHNGKTANLSPCNFESLGCHHYNITFDVNNGQVGIAQLTITFDDELTRENVTIDLTEELFTTPAPTLSPVGFASGDTVEAVKDEHTVTPVKFNVMARGGLASAIMTFQSTTFTPPFGTETELCNASESIQDALRQMGIDAKGFFHPDQMAYLDLSGLAAHLPVGQHTITLIAKDAVDRASEPVSVTLNVVALDLTAASPGAVFGEGTATVNIDYNGMSPETDLTFKAMDDLGNYVDAPILSLEIDNTRAIETKKYKAVIKLPETERSKIPVRMYRLGKEEPVAEFTVEVTLPDYSIQVDPHATYAVIKVTPGTGADVEKVTKRLYTTLTGASASQATKSVDAANGYVTLYGLTANSNYTLSHSLAPDAAEKKSATFTTEAAAQLPNADFSETEETIHIDPINVGGTYTGTLGSVPKYQTTSSIIRNTPTGWATVNALTCYPNAANLNSWFVVPSTWAENGSAVIRSVGYSHNGTTPDNYKKTGVYYCANTPSRESLTPAAGELFLGTYTFNGTENRTDGISWASRPTSLTFDYGYTSVNNEEGEVSVQILDASNNVIASATKTMGAATAGTPMTLNLTGYTFGTKAAKIKVCFKSTKTGTTPTFNIPTGNALNDGGGLSSKKIKANSYKSLATGSVLTIDNIVLGYDTAQGSKVKSRKTTKRRR